MNDSILNTVKRLLGLAEEYTPFDTEIIVFINSALLTLKQIGVGDGFTINGAEETFADFLTNPALVPLVKNYLFYKVKMVWDVNSMSQNAFTAYKEQLAECEWRIREENEKVIYPNDDQSD